MINHRIIPIASMELRKQWLKKLGGLTHVSVKNKEWLILLQEDTRQSLMIEGEFVDKRELKAIISDRSSRQDYPVVVKVLGYFDSALAAYEHAFQQLQVNEFRITKPLIRQMHSMMFRNDERFPYQPGEWRRGSITITGSKIETIPYHRVEEAIDRLIFVINRSTTDPIRKAAIAHSFFEQIHPFPDGNGRVGRMLLNFILIAHGFPNIAVKGMERDRNKYISALEQTDAFIYKVLHGQIPWSKVSTRSSQFSPLEELINKNLAISLDTVICLRFEEMKESLISIDKVARQTKKNIASFRVACSQKKIISASVKNVLVSHPDLLKAPK